MKMLIYSVVASVVLGCSAAFGGLLEDTFQGAVDLSVQVTTAPAQVIINTAQVVTGSAPPSVILDPIKEAGRTGGQTLSGAVQLGSIPSATFYQEAQELAQQTGGDAGAFVFDITTISNRLYDKVAQSSGMAAANLLMGNNPLDFVGIPLASAIREARERHLPSARPLPPEVISALESEYPDYVLSRAKWCVGRVEISLPNGINHAMRFLGSDHAVTVDDVIVFNTEPPSFGSSETASFWWAHEVAHVWQYTDMGVDEFAGVYVRSGGSDIENDADGKAQAGLALFYDGDMADFASLSPNRMSSPNYPAAFASLPANHDPAIIQCVFPQDPMFRYFGTQQGRIIAVDPRSGFWMHIGWAIPPDIGGPQWIYFIPGRGSYDVYPNGAIIQRFTPYGPQQVGYVIGL